MRAFKDAVVYYRIRLYDRSGRTTLSNTVALKVTAASAITVYPNPVKQTANIVFAAAGKYTIDLITATGQVVNTQQADILAGGTSTKLARNTYPAGVYMLRITNIGSKKADYFKLIFE